MRITKPTRFPERRGVRLTKAAGWIAIAFGAVHVITAPLESRPRDIWSQVVDEGWWNTFTLDKATTLAELERSETFWSHWAASAFRCWCSVCTSSGRPANANACGVDRLDPLAWALPFVTALPASPGWALAISGGLIVLGDRRRSRATPLLSGHESWSKEEEEAA